MRIKIKNKVKFFHPTARGADVSVESGDKGKGKGKDERTAKETRERGEIGDGA